MPCVLMFNLSSARQGAVRMLCAGQKLRVRAVEKKEYARPLSSLPSAPAKDEPEYEGEGFSEEMLLLVDFSQAHLDAFLQGFRAYRIAPVALKAILTPTNAAWNAQTLYLELCSERAALQKGAAAHGRS